LLVEAEGVRDLAREEVQVVTAQLLAIQAEELLHEQK
jgi:hypothetical protein